MAEPVAPPRLGYNGGMPKTLRAVHPLIELLSASSRPIYAVDAERRIVYCNPALETWLELAAERIVGRHVEYHSEPDADGDSPRGTSGPLTGLCPPPRALAGEVSTGTVSCVPRDGRLVHRHAEFVPLHVGDSLGSTDLASARDSHSRDGDTRLRGGVLALLATANLSPTELTAQLSTEPTEDDLHRTIRRFRRAQAGRYSLESLLGTSSAMRRCGRKSSAAASGANVLICGRRGTGRASVARAIHYHAAGEGTVKLVPIDGDTLSDEGLRRAIDLLSGSTADASRRPTLLIQHLERVSATHQSQVVETIRRGALAARIIATTCELASPANTTGNADGEPACEINSALRDAVSTITIHLPRLADRPDDLPLLAQFFLEAANRGNPKQVGSIRPEALDLVALYTWPGELDELRDAIAAAHRAAATHTIAPGDLPAVVHHAAKAAALPQRTQQPIVLDDLLTTIEKEAIVRA